jgi:hypothetical protein
MSPTSGWNKTTRQGTQLLRAGDRLGLLFQHSILRECDGALKTGSGDECSSSSVTSVLCCQGYYIKEIVPLGAAGQAATNQPK